MLRISELFIYPIKSLGGISLDHARVTDRGFEHDRRWMLVDPNHVFMTQRELPVMALVRVSLGQDGLHVSSRLHPDPLFIPYRPVSDETAEVRVWDDVCGARFVSAEADDWFSSALGRPCRLVYMPDEILRVTDQKYAPPGSITSWADAFPFLLIGQASLDDLNSRLSEALPMNRFRPNIVFTGGAPFFEDSLLDFSVGQVQFRGVKLCARCPIPTTDQETGLRGKEPLRTLTGYRFRNNKVLFGQNLVHRGVGEIAVGDELIPVF